MSDADDAFDSQAATLRAVSRESSRHHQRRSSTNERLDEILENARERADSFAQDDGLMTPSLRHSPTSLSFDDANVDESSAMLGRRLSSYQGTWGSRADTDGAGPRVRKSAYARSHSLTLGHPAREEPGERGETEDPEDAASDRPSWWEKAISPFRSVELENKGSVARDHLALERTFLAWLRTSLAFASIGIAVTQLFRLNTALPEKGSNISQDTLRHVGRPLGAAFIIISILILLLGYRRFFLGQRWIIRGKFPASRGTVMIVVIVAFAIMVLSLVVVLMIHPKKAL